ncbi:hypothetical protein ACQPU1_08595 [Clostridium paraputrificum]|uniref:hypothetical protein n=1 Tax=Clostridium TaxID=1485 RepID=UPI003D358FFF
MVRKKIVLLVLTLSMTFSTILFGCSAKKTLENTGDMVEEGANKVGDSVKEGVDKVGETAKDVGESGSDLISKITDTSMEYSRDDFKVALENKGYKLQKVEGSKSIFSVENDEYSINGDRISIYEYGKDDRAKLEGDIKTITENGTMINGSRMNWTSAPHIYKKGRIVVVYDGNNETTLTALKEILGNSILG